MTYFKPSASLAGFISSGMIKAHLVLGQERTINCGVISLGWRLRFRLLRTARLQVVVEVFPFQFDFALQDK